MTAYELAQALVAMMTADPATRDLTVVTQAPWSAGSGAMFHYEVTGVEAVDIGVVRSKPRVKLILG